MIDQVTSSFKSLYWFTLPVTAQWSTKLEYIWPPVSSLASSPTSVPHVHSIPDTPASWLSLNMTHTLHLIYHCMMVNLMCPLDQVMRCPYIWSNIILSVPVRVFLNEVNTCFNFIKNLLSVRSKKTG